MARIIAIGPGGKPQAPSRDTRFAAVVLQALQQHGFGRLILSPPCSTWDQADDVRRGLYRSAGHYCSCGDPMCHRKYRLYCPQQGQRISTQAEIVKDDKDRLRVQFQLFDKKDARRSHIKRYGSDRTRWPYDPKAKRSK
jgi:hypothetical protein